MYLFHGEIESVGNNTFGTSKFSSKFPKITRMWNNCFFSKIHTAHRILENLRNLHVQMAKGAVPKMKCIISYWRLHQVGSFCFVHLCRAPLHEECPQHHGHKGDPGVTPGTCGAIGERDQVILMWVRAPGI